METYGKILIIAMPLFLLLVLFEKWYGWKKGFETVRTLDMISSLSSGVTNSTKDVLGLSIAIISYEWLVNHIAIYHIQTNWIIYLIAFLALDFAGYWTHRLAHEINFFWNNHIIHHSSEEFNLACALRQSVSVFVRIYAVLLIPAALLGVPAQVIAIVAPLHLFAQFWYHTRHIQKMGWLEYIIVTPSHHRVHHAMNPEYLDKNYGQIFIFWDKLFGTYQEELDEVPAVFGITRPAQTWNPFRINFQHLWLLISDAWRAENWKDRLTIWFKPTGWRPENFEEKYPVTKIADVYSFTKYGTQHSKILMYWSTIQMFVTLGLVSYLYLSIAQMELQNIFIYGTFIFISVYSYTELMDTNNYSLFWETVRLAFGIGIIIYLGNWFNIDTNIPFGTLIISSYLVLSWGVNFYFVSSGFKSEKLAIA